MTSKQEQAKTISSNIKELRGKIDWNQSKLAQEAGITGAALSKIEQGERVPTIVVLKKIASALNVEVHELTGEQPVERSEQEERNLEFYRKFKSINDLDDKDQQLLLEMAERLKGLTDK
ncbi:helix-turn-helix domain-containing protein [Colwellia polaris]|uniref:helix-turn-helix domain-containing protein n=1 Tax=Colwellia polaris TaxID=326537 RepID=UPI000A177DF3|nr:helix-turn-helix transcriptional regulator [Colwellia polaris]